MNAIVRCKFDVHRIIHENSSRGVPTPEGGWTSVKFPIRVLEMRPVSAKDPGSENYKFWSATPSGEASVILTPEAAAEFAPDQELYLDFAPVDPNGEEQLLREIFDEPDGTVGVFRVDEISRKMGSEPQTQGDGTIEWTPAPIGTVKLYPVMHSEDWGNDDCWPLRGGYIEFGAANMRAVEAFQLDGKYFLRLTRAPADAS